MQFTNMLRLRQLRVGEQRISKLPSRIQTSFAEIVHTNKDREFSQKVLLGFSGNGEELVFLSNIESLGWFVEDFFFNNRYADLSKFCFLEFW